MCGIGSDRFLGELEMAVSNSAKRSQKTLDQGLGQPRMGLIGSRMIESDCAHRAVDRKLNPKSNCFIDSFCFLLFILSPYVNPLPALPSNGQGSR